MAFKLFNKTKADSLMSSHKAEDFFDVWKLKNKKYVPMTINYKKRKPRQLFKEKHFFSQWINFYFQKKTLYKDIIIDLVEK